MSFFEKTEKGILVRIKLTPKASSNSIDDLFQDENGVFWLKAKVTAVPENGKANKALVNLLSKIWKIPKSNFLFVAGELDRYKILSLKQVDSLDEFKNKCGKILPQQKLDLILFLVYTWFNI